MVVPPARTPGVNSFTNTTSWRLCSKAFSRIISADPPGPVLAHPVEIKFKGTERSPKWNGPHEVGSALAYRDGIESVV